LRGGIGRKETQDAVRLDAVLAIGLPRGREFCGGGEEADVRKRGARLLTSFSGHNPLGEGAGYKGSSARLRRRRTLHEITGHSTEDGIGYFKGGGKGRGGKRIKEYVTGAIAL